MEDSNYKWEVKKFNLYECGDTTFVTHHYEIYFVHYVYE